MPRPFPEAQARAFLIELARTGNVRHAAALAGANRATLTRRRARDPGFAAAWEGALAAAQGRLDPGGAPAGATRLVRLASGRVQRRRRPPRALTPDAERAFLLALSATANVRLAAAAAGFSHTAFYHRRRESPAFAREMRAALEQGCERLTAALLEAGLEGDPERAADWRANDPPAIPPMTANQALQLLYLHQKEITFGGTVWDLAKRRRGEPEAAYRERLFLMADARLEREREKYRVAEAEHAARASAAPPPDDAPPPLPDLGQVTGWSAANPAKTPHDPSRALFGGWRAKGRWEG